MEYENIGKQIMEFHKLYGDNRKCTHAYISHVYQKNNIAYFEENTLNNRILSRSNGINLLSLRSNTKCLYVYAYENQ